MNRLCWFLLIVGWIGSIDAAGKNGRKIGAPKSCSDVKRTWENQRFGNLLLPETMISGSALTVCSPSSRTCCNLQMEEKLLSRGRQDHQHLIGQKLGQVKTNFATGATRFKAFCLELITNASRDLHSMFTKTYGVLYEQNSAVFTSLFRDLHRFYRGADLSLPDALERFFATLLQRIFVLLNTHYTFDGAYLQCVTRHAEEMKPFGDVPQKLSVHLKRAFVAARTFLHGVVVGGEVMAAVEKLEPSAACSKALTRLLYCPYCSGLVSVLPCRPFCLNVLRGCMASQAELTDAWDPYIDAMLKLVERLESSFSIESVLDPMDVKISDAIMNVQENSEAVTAKIFQTCGQPTLGARTKRQASLPKRTSGMDVSPRQEQSLPRHTSGTDASPRQDKSRTKIGPRRESQTNVIPRNESLAEDSFVRRESRDHRYVRPTASSAGTPFGRMLAEFKQLLSASKDIWSGLSTDVCGTVAAPDKDEARCWNGDGRGSYSKSVVGDGVANNTDNPEVVVDTRWTNVVVSHQILLLKQITLKLRNAHSGLDVDWTHVPAVNDEEDHGSGGDDEEFASGGADDPGLSDDEDFPSFTHPPHTTRPPAMHHHAVVKHSTFSFAHHGRPTARSRYAINSGYSSVLYFSRVLSLLACSLWSVYLTTATSPWLS